MTQVWADSLLAVTLVSLVSLVGLVTLTIKGDVLNRLVFALVSLAVGALLGDALIHLLPEAYKTFPGDFTVAFLTLGGFLLFFLVEKYLHWHHHHDENKGVHIHPVGYMNLISDGIHNFIDGVLIGTSYLVSLPLGFATTLAVIAHEIPQEIGDFGVLIGAGFTRRRALLVNFISGCTAIVGTIVALSLGGRVEALVSYSLPVAAGGFLYIAGTDLLPQLQNETKPQRSAIQFFVIVLGVAIMALLKYFQG